jgi:hypothetical protein
MTRKHVYREGDPVRIVNPIIVKRVGYAFDIHAEAQRIGEQHLADINALFDKILPDLAPIELGRDHYSFDGLALKLAFIVGRYRGLGGKERRLWTEEQPDVLNHRWFVSGKRVAMTGTYYPPGGRYTYDGDYDYEPGGLEHAKGHLLLKLNRRDWLGDTIEVEACNVMPEPQEGSDQ